GASTTVVETVCELLPDCGSATLLLTLAVLLTETPSSEASSVIVPLVELPLGITPRFRESTPLTRETVPPVADWNVTPAGSVSARTTLVASFGPALLTVNE